MMIMIISLLALYIPHRATEVHKNCHFDYVSHLCQTVTDFQNPFTGSFTFSGTFALKLI